MSGTGLRVVICDDDAERTVEWRNRIDDATNGRIAPVALTPDEFGNAVGALKERKAAGKRSEPFPATDAAGRIDDADILILDSDLTPDGNSAQGDAPSEAVAQHLVGELGGEVAHLARCYSTAGPIVVVNQRRRHRAYDLTMLETASEVADVYLSEADIDNIGLWFPAEAESGSFRPWHWPSLAELPSQLTDFLRGAALDQTVLSALSCSVGDLDALAGHQLDALGLQDFTEDTTLEEIAESSDFGLRPKEATPPQYKLRVAVFGLRRWLDCHVLPAHNLWVDLPHLFQRQPWSHPSRGNPGTWNTPERWWDLSQAQAAPAGYAPGASRLLGRPVWRWRDLAGHAPSGARILPGDPVFCEDISGFRDAATVRDFTSDLAGGNAQRFVAKLEDVDYYPRRRLLT